MKAASEKLCPEDFTVGTDEGKRTATVHWNPFEVQGVDLSDS